MARLGEALDSSERVVALGECGLDFHYDFATPADQRRVFDLQMRIAEDRDLPLVVHCREAEAEMAGRVRDAGTAGIRGVLHCFTGDARTAERAVGLGLHVSFSGIVTFRAADSVREAAAVVPDDRLLVETDAPYLAPVPHRGKRNEPAWVGYVADMLAEVRGVTPDVLRARTAAAFEALFGRDLSGQPPRGVALTVGSQVCSDPEHE